MSRFAWLFYAAAIVLLIAAVLRHARKADQAEDEIERRRTRSP